MARIQTKALPLRDVPEAEILAALDAAAMEAAPEVRALFREAIAAIIKETDFAQWSAALEFGDVEFAVRSVPWHRVQEILGAVFGKDGPLLRALAEGVRIGAEMLPGLPVTFDDLAPRATAYLEHVGAERITAITAETRDGIRAVLKQTFGSPLSIAETRREIRSVLGVRQLNGLIGLRTEQADALNRKIVGWVDDPDLSAARIQQLIDREYARQLKDRADLIARTEAFDAANHGQTEAWREINREGRARIVGLESAFVSDEVGERRLAYTALRPPLHPRCYCFSRLISREDDFGNVYYVREWLARVVGACPRCRAMDGRLAV